MPKFKKKEENKKINFGGSPEPKEYPIFCFKHLTSNKKYNFDYFGNDREQKEAKSLILDEILKLQKKSWAEWGLENKKTGYESLPITQINISPKDFITTNDIKVIVFRINSQRWRLLGIKSQHFKSVLHVIGFDFDYSAYKH